MGRLFWIVIALIGIVLLLLMLNNDAGSTLGLENESFARFAYLGIWGIVLGAAILGSGIPLGHVLRNLAIWIVLILMLVTGYQYRYELQDVGHRITAGLIPGSPISTRDGEGMISVTLVKADNGHFEVRGEVNGATVPFMVDTGASAIVLSAEDAHRAGLDPDKLTYRTPVMTANGMANAANVTLDSVSIGAIERRNIR
ncbi:MAG: retropepsin-like aspartic protease family protein, partial [Alphaproteobacteria bacterium]